MTSVFIVISHDIESDTIHGVFTRQDLADAMGKDTGASVEEWPLDLPPEERVRFCCNIFKGTGKPSGMNVHEIAASARGILNHPPVCNYGSKEWMNITAYGTTQESAVETAKAFFDNQAKFYEFIP